MKKVLFFPLLKMPSGHHQVADAIADYIKSRNDQIECRKIDLLSTWNPIIESIITKTYLQWIHYSPKSYAWMYKQFAYASGTQRSYKYYEILFYKKMKEIVQLENPDLIICTHGFPSYFLSKLRVNCECNAPIINVYTDFFINDVWGRDGIDYHFVPDSCIKKQLIQQDNRSNNQVFVTGIPIAEQFQTPIQRSMSNPKYRVLVSGGSVGLGKITELLQGPNKVSDIHFYVLCGKNKKLFQQLTEMNHNHIHPLPYITSRQEMNDLYNMADAIITKTGGVTISEALKKKIPIFIHSSLPGQEEINLQYLKKQKLVFELNKNHSIEKQIIEVLKDKKSMELFQKSIDAYMDQLDLKTPESIYQFIQSVLQFDKELSTFST